MNIEQFHERAWRGLLAFAHTHYGRTEEAKIVVHPATRAMLAIESERFEWYRAPDGAERYMGQPLEMDPRLGEDDILIRCEAKA